MPSKLKKAEYSFLPLVVTEFNVRSSYGINHKARDTKYSRSDTKIYQQNSTIELECRNIDPDEPLSDIYQFSIYGHSDGPTNPDLTLADCHVCDEEGIKKYRKSRGVERPVYDVPKGISALLKSHGRRQWSSALWLQPDIVSDMIVLLLSKLDIYVACHIRHENQVAWLIELYLQTANPLD